MIGERARRGSQSAGNVLLLHLGAGYMLTFHAAQFELYTSVNFLLVSSASVKRDSNGQQRLKATGLDS